jgi:hypothetical protein
MQEGIVLAVNIGHEVFRAFGQVQDGLKLDDFGGSGLNGGILGGEQLQVVQALRGKLKFCIHFYLFSGKWVG